LTAKASTDGPRTAGSGRIGKRAGLGAVHPHMLRAAFIMAALDAGVPLRRSELGVFLFTAEQYDRARASHPADRGQGQQAQAVEAEQDRQSCMFAVVVAYVAGG
jgi:hypothetical protein